jgi:hypothetical protein
MPEDVIIERIDNLKEFFREEFKQNNVAHQTLQKTMDDNHEDHEKRIRKLEDWKLVFTAKLSVYVTVAVTIGSLLGTLIIHWISKFI